MRVQVVQPVVGVVQERPKRAETVVRSVLADGEQLGLGPIDRFLDVRAILVADGGDLACGPDQAPQNGLALHDPAVLGDVDGGGSVIAERGEVARAADCLQFAIPFQRLRDGDHVYRLAVLEEAEHRREDAAVGLAVEVLGVQEVRHLDDRVAIYQDGAEHGLLRVQVLWRQSVDHGLAGLLSGVQVKLARVGSACLNRTEVSRSIPSPEWVCCLQPVDNYRG